MNMAKTFRIGVLGLTHDHIWSDFCEELYGGGRLIGSRRSAPAFVRAHFAQESARAVSDSSTLLAHAREELDAVYIYRRQRERCRVAERRRNEACSDGRKAAGPDLTRGRRILAAVAAGRGRLMVNWPLAWWPQLQHAFRLASAGDDR